MRPRVFPAEDLVTHSSAVWMSLASMRPRVFPAEDPLDPCHRSVNRGASMRPRVFPAEDFKKDESHESSKGLQ